ncbi:hypothetical protein RIF29_03927 [Crotalaria pallida]|uniref:Uncharacterized protein n=1 Tax=Crotalaria pallida TaxID=3830 RepID=A0AAN9J0I1_CROPI
MCHCGHCRFLCRKSPQFFPNPRLHKPKKMEKEGTTTISWSSTEEAPPSTTTFLRLVTTFLRRAPLSSPLDLLSLTPALPPETHESKNIFEDESSCEKGDTQQRRKHHLRFEILYDYVDNFVLDVLLEEIEEVDEVITNTPGSEQEVGIETFVTHQLLPSLETIIEKLGLLHCVFATTQKTFETRVKTVFLQMCGTTQFPILPHPSSSYLRAIPTHQLDKFQMASVHSVWEKLPSHLVREGINANSLGPII